MPFHPDLTEELQLRMRRHVLKKGAEVAAKLEQLLAGQDIRLEHIPFLGTPDQGWKKIERLRHYLKALNAALRRIDSGEVGRCNKCDQAIPILELVEMPWADQCCQCKPKNTS